MRPSMLEGAALSHQFGHRLTGGSVGSACATPALTAPSQV